jgi:hypothetical protein
MIHIVGLLGFQYTNVIWYLAPGAFHIGLNMFIFVFGTAAALSPNFKIEKLDEDVDRHLGYRFLSQIAAIVTATQLFMVGYAFFAGMAVLQSTVLALAVVLQKVFEKE